MSLRVDGDGADLESPFVAESRWSEPGLVENEADPWVLPAHESEWEARGETPEMDETLAFEDEGLCRECGHSLELEAPFVESFEAIEGELPRQDEIAFEAELGIGFFESLFEREDVPSDVQSFVQTFGAEWSRRRSGTPSADKMAEWLTKDYQATVAGARHRWGKKVGTKISVGEISRAWMIGREQNMQFQLAPKLPSIGPFAPPAGAVALGPSKWIEDSAKAPVAPLAAQFAEALHRRFPQHRASNYRGHGGGKFDGRGFSLDLYLSGTDDRGFYQPDLAIEFLHAVHDTATSVGAQWRVLYNDFSVAGPVNRALGKVHVGFMGTTRASGGLNWHGPAPLILHFHLDLAPLAGSASTWKGSATPTSSSAVPPAATADALGPEAVRFAQRVLNATERESLSVDGDLGKLTRAAIERFRTRYGLGSDGLDSTLVLALAQRALEELAQQSLFAQTGVRDAATNEALARFKQQHGLGIDSTIDGPTRRALADALEARAPAPPHAALRTGGKSIESAVVTRIDQHREIIERVAADQQVSPHLLRGIIAAESGGKAHAGAGGSGYKGLMQCDRDEAQLQPEVSVKCGARKFLQFAQSMRGFFRDVLHQSWESIDKDTRIRIVMAAYNAGPGTVKQAMRFANAAGDVSQWLKPEFYVHALLVTGAYNPVPDVLEWCVKKGHLTKADLAEDLARLSGRPVDEFQSLSLERLAGALKPLLFSEKARIKGDASSSLSALQARASKALVCAAQFKQTHTGGYLEKILVYRNYFETRN